MIIKHNKINKLTMFNMFNMLNMLNKLGVVIVVSDCPGDRLNDFFNDLTLND